MKQIKCIKQLQAEKNRIKRQQDALEMEMLNNWNKLKTHLHPVSFAKEAFNHVLQYKTSQNLNSESILKNSLTYGVTLLANRMMEKAEKKLGGYLKK
jgi:predicted Zn-dependent peptidase